MPNFDNCQWLLLKYVSVIKMYKLVDFALEIDTLLILHDLNKLFNVDRENMTCIYFAKIA